LFFEVPHDEGMPLDPSSLRALQAILAEADLILETSPALPQNRTAACRELLRTAIVLTNDLVKQQRMTPAAVIGCKGGSSTMAKLGSEHFRQLAARRKIRAGGRPRKKA